MSANTPYRVLVGFDGSDLSKEALHQAFSQAMRQPRSEVHVVHIEQAKIDALMAASSDSWFPSENPASEHSALRIQVMRVFQAWKHKMSPEMNWKKAGLPETPTRPASTPPASALLGGIQRIEVHSRVDFPVHGILSLAEELDVGMIVMGTHGHKGIRRFLFGSIAEEIVRKASCPVLVVHLDAQADSIPEIEPPCPQCVAVRFATQGKQQWCQRHREHHTFGHAYHYESRAAQVSQRTVL